MITLKRMRWANAFSYGPANSIDFTASPITQLVGSNGHGKSSIALILEEVLYNKNSKGVKKGDILNRYSKEKKYWIELELEVDGVDYVIRTDRSNATQSVSLSSNSVDLSSHTSTATYKQIEELMGMDHKTFAQIVYQSHAGSLEFLTATDSVRKKFLVEILQLGRYTEYGDKFKALANESSKESDKLTALIASVEARISKLEKQDRTYRDLVPVPDISALDGLRRRRAETELSLENVDEYNDRIVTNNKLLAQLRALTPATEPAEVVKPVLPEPVDTLDMRTRIATLTQTKDAASKFVLKMRGLKGMCPTCLSEIDTKHTHALESEQQVVIDSTETELHELELRLKEAEVVNLYIKSKEAEYAKALKAYNLMHTAYVEYTNKAVRLEASINHNLPTATTSDAELKAEIESLNDQINAIAKAVKIAEDHNKAAEVHNAKIAVIEGQLTEAKEELAELQAKLATVSATLFKRSTLANVFSNNGLIAYKIESLVTDLEDLSNEFLSDLSDGRFSISFKVSTSDKLNVVITDNGKDIDILALSGGERARVNAAVLLAIRKLMQSLSGNRINLMILDETIEALDQHGKEKLIEVLIAQEHLNTFLVSHGFTHPLLDKVLVTKQQNQSRLER